MKQLEEEALINGLNYWGKKVLGRSKFGEECLWSTAGNQMNILC